MRERKTNFSERYFFLSILFSRKEEEEEEEEKTNNMFAIGFFNNRNEVFHCIHNQSIV